MKTTRLLPKLSGLALLLATLNFHLSICAATLRVWSGGAVMSNAWTNGPNWSGNIAPVPGDDLQFPYDATKSNSNDNYTNGITFNSIQFWHGPNSTPNRIYDLTGNSIALNAGVSAVNSFPGLWLNSLSNAFLLNSNQTFSTGPYTGLLFNGPINLNGKDLTFDTAASAPIDVRAVISGAGNLIKTNPGTLTLWSNNTYTGSTIIANGTFTLSGSAKITNSANITLTGASAIFTAGNGSTLLYTGQTLSGIGSVSAGLTVLAGGVISPGNNGVGILTLNNSLTLETGATLLANFNGTNAGANYNTLNVQGSVTLLNPTLALTLGYAPAPGDSFVIISNAGASAVNGTFNGLPEGTFFTNSGASFRISYTGGDGNDVVLTRTNPLVPGPSIIVTTTADSGVGSLRAALAAATNGNSIVFATNVTGAIKLTTGELLVNQNVFIFGPGPAILAVDGNAASRVFHVTNGVTAFISGLTITNGAVSGSSDGHVGGGIWNDHSALTLSNCTVIFNNGGNGPGGALYNDGSSGSASLRIISSTFSRNYTVFGSGGAIYNNGEAGNATLSMIASTLNNNVAQGVSTIVGGGIFNNGYSGSATLTMTNCTSYSNIAQGYGGGIYNNGGLGTGAVTVVACTFADDAQGGFGDCLYANGSGAKLQIGNTIVDHAVTHSSIQTQSGGVVISLGYNLASDSANNLFTNSTDQIFKNPKLSSIADNGGPTQTAMPQWGSPAIDKGMSFGITTDQRGVSRPHDLSSITNASGGDGSDIGAVEFVPPPAQFISVTTLGNAVQVQGAGLSNLSYTIQAASNLNSVIPWTNIGSATANSNGVFSFTDTNSLLFPMRFYRTISP